MEEDKNYYQILEVHTDAEQNEIDSAYIRAKNSYSGDSIAMYSLLSEQDCLEILENIEEAYSILGDEEKRQQYDKARGIQRSSAGSEPKKPRIPKDKVQPELATDLTGDTIDQVASASLHREDPISYDRYKSITKTENTGVSKVEALKKFKLQYDIDEQFEQQIENCVEFSGEFLKEIREYKNVSIPRLAEMSKISKTYLQYIEQEAYDKLPAPVYLRGFIYQYAKCLKLNTDYVASSYMKRYHVAKS